MRSAAYIFVASLFVILSLNQAVAHTPVEFLEVLKVDPANSIEHAVDLQGVYDLRKVSSNLVGPEYFALAVGCFDRAAKKTKAYQQWYRIADPMPEPQRTVTVLDLVRGSENMTLSIGTAEYFLSPAQRITSGQPAPVPQGLDQYKAYRVVDPVSLASEIRMDDGTQQRKRQLSIPLFVCVPVEEWHHDDYFASSHPRACFVVYQLDPQSDDRKIHTLDQFGLNQLQVSKSEWLTVHGTLLESGK